MTRLAHTVSLLEQKQRIMKAITRRSKYYGGSSRWPDRVYNELSEKLSLPVYGIKDEQADQAISLLNHSYPEQGDI